MVEEEKFETAKCYIRKVEKWLMSKEEYIPISFVFNYYIIVKMHGNLV